MRRYCLHLLKTAIVCSISILGVFLNPWSCSTAANSFIIEDILNYGQINGLLGSVPPVSFKCFYYIYIDTDATFY